MAKAYLRASVVAGVAVTVAYVAQTLIWSLIPPTPGLRYSVTFRTLAPNARRPNSR